MFRHGLCKLTTELAEAEDRLKMIIRVDRITGVSSCRNLSNRKG